MGRPIHRGYAGFVKEMLQVELGLSAVPICCPLHAVAISAVQAIVAALPAIWILGQICYSIPPYGTSKRKRSRERKNAG